MKNYFQGTVENPYHLSVGAVVVNEQGEICTHYFKDMKDVRYKGVDDFYLLMRETIEPNESIETCLARGLMEEWGITAKLERFLGSIISHFPRGHMEVEKTTPYFLFSLISQDISKRGGDIESTSEIRWMKKDDLISKMKEQGLRIGREDVNESLIVERI